MHMMAIGTSLLKYVPRAYPGRPETSLSHIFSLPFRSAKLEQEAYLVAFAPGLKREDFRLKVRRGVEKVEASDSSGIAQVITSSRIGEIQLMGEFSMFFKIGLKRSLSQYFSFCCEQVRIAHAGGIRSPLIFSFSKLG